MLVLESWLKEFVQYEATVQEVAEALTLTGLEVEGIEPAWPWLEAGMAVKVVETEPLPERAWIKRCIVETGSSRIQLVCGAPNVRAGMVTAFIPAGTEMPDGKVVKKAELYGIPSEGMLCSEKELFLVGDHSGIMELDTEPGTDLSTALNCQDTVLEIGITPNRPDCLSTIGVAREVAALFKKELNRPRIPDLPEQLESALNIQIAEPDLCSRYAGILIEGIEVKDSPRWLALRLLACGVRPINNIVDITNHILLEMGQPLHAFDFDTLQEQRIVVRRAGRGEKITTLDGKERELDDSMLTICDAAKPVAIAGIMGGMDTEVTGQTRRVLIESAWFNPSSIRRTAKRLKLSTEASYRFERGVDPLLQMDAALRAAELMTKLAGGTIKAVRDENPRPYRRLRVEMRPARVNRLIGTEISQSTMKELIESIEMKVVETRNIEITDPQGQLFQQPIMEVEIPSFRPDIYREIDIVEEVARLYGFANIPTRMPVAPIATERAESSKEFHDQLRNRLSGMGMTEIISYSFISPDELHAFGLTDGDPRLRAVPLLNPLAEDQSIMRTFLSPSLLSAISRNLRRRNLDLRFFEIGAVFISQGEETLPEEHYQLAMAITGRRFPLNWAWPQIQADYFDLKGITENLFASLNLAGARFTDARKTETYLIPGTQLEIFTSDNQLLGRIGQVTPEVLKRFDIDQPLFICEIELAPLKAAAREQREFTPLPRYPAMELDLALVLDDTIRAGEIMEFIEENRPALLESYLIFDVYRGKQVPKGKKSLALRFIYRAVDHTLSDQEVEQVHEPLAQAILSRFNAQLRS